MQIHKHRLKAGLNTIDGVEQLVYMNYQDTKLYGWFIASADTNYEVYVAVTGEQVPDEYRYVTSVQLHVGNGHYVIHAFD